MKIKVLTYLTILSVVVASCGGTKELTDATNQGSRSVNDYPYIEQFHKAVRLKVKGNNDEAIAAFNKCLELRQDDDAVYYSLAKIYQEKKDLSLAAENFKKAQAIDPNNIWYTEEVAMMYYNNSQFDLAKPEFEKLVSYEPKNIEWLYSYGDCLLRTGETQKAIDQLTKAEDFMGKNPALTAEKYRLYMSLKKETEALNEVHEARKTFPKDPQLIGILVEHYFNKGEPNKGIAFLEELIEADPTNGRAKLALADIYRQQNKQEESMQLVREAFNSPDVDLDLKMRTLISLQSLSSANEDGLALAKLLTEQYPNEAASHTIYADYLINNQREDEALVEYKKALQFDKDQYAIWNQVMVMDYQRGNFKELYVYGKEAVELFPVMPTFFLLYGVGAMNENHLEEAIESFSVGKDLIISDKPMEAEFTAQLGEAYFRQKNYSEGKSHFEKAIKLDPSSNLVKNNYAYQLAKANQELDKALTLVDAALSRSPNSAAYMDTKGFVLFMKGEYSEAEGYFLKALELIPNEKEIVEHLGDAYFKNGKVDAALTEWKKARDNGNNSALLLKKIQDKKYYAPQD